MFAPPLVVTGEEIDRLVSVVRESVKAAVGV
jgi:hypothetical protein